MRGGMRRAAAVIAALAMMAIGFALGLRSGGGRAAEKPDYGACTPAELSWIAEGMERISQMNDELERVRRLMEAAPRPASGPGGSEAAAVADTP